MSKYQILEWDSNFFGFAVARIMPRRISCERLHDMLIDLKKNNIKLVYWATDDTDTESHITAKYLGGYLADKKITYSIDLKTISKNKILSSIKVKEYDRPMPNSELENLAIQSGIYSRYNLDPNFSKSQFEKLYRNWIFNSTNKTISDAVLVIYEKNKIVGMITLVKVAKNGSIGLIAVDSSMRGKGLGVALISAAISWFKMNGCDNLEVVTQTRNIAACNLYEKMGFSEKKVELFFHFWL